MYANIEIPLNYVMASKELRDELERHYVSESNDAPTIEEFVEGSDIDPYWEDWESTLAIRSQVGTRLALSNTDAVEDHFVDVCEFCENRNIPYDRIIEGDYEAGTDYVRWYRPGMDEAKYTDAPGGRSSISIIRIREILDSQPEEMSDQEVLDHFMREVNKIDYDSPQNRLTNWCSFPIEESML